MYDAESFTMMTMMRPVPPRLFYCNSGLVHLIVAGSEKKQWTKENLLVPSQVVHELRT